MKKLSITALLLTVAALFGLDFAAQAQVLTAPTVTLGRYNDWSLTPRPLTGVVLFNPDGTIATLSGGGGGGSTPTGTAGSPNTAVVTVQGISGGVALPVTGTFWQAVQPVSMTTLPALTAGSAIIGNVRIDQTTPGTTNGVTNVPAAVATAGIAPAATTVAAGSQVVKASAGNLYALNVTAGATAGWVMIFNATTVPADGTVTPAKCMPLAANTGVDFNWRAAPTYFSTGITVVFSSTGCFTKTISATAFISGDAK